MIEVSIHDSKVGTLTWQLPEEVRKAAEEDPRIEAFIQKLPRLMTSFMLILMSHIYFPHLFTPLMTSMTRYFSGTMRAMLRFMEDHLRENDTKPPPNRKLH